jgi:hypothetical protein
MSFSGGLFGREIQQNQIRAHQCNPWFLSSSCLPALLIPRFGRAIRRDAFINTIRGLASHRREGDPRRYVNDSSPDNSLAVWAIAPVERI